MWTGVYLNLCIGKYAEVCYIISINNMIEKSELHYKIVFMENFNCPLCLHLYFFVYYDYTMKTDMSP